MQRDNSLESVDLGMGMLRKAPSTTSMPDYGRRSFLAWMKLVSG